MTGSEQADVRAVVRYDALVGFWTTLLASLFAIAASWNTYRLAVGEIRCRLTGECAPASYAFYYGMNQMFPMISGLLLAVMFVFIAVVIHRVAASERKVWSMSGFGFALVYATLTISNYYLQLTVVRHSALVGDIERVALIATGYPGSSYVPLELLGYAFMGLATFFAAPSIVGGRLGIWIRVFFVVNGVVGVGAAVANFFKVSPIYPLWGMPVWGVVFPVMTVLLALHFGRIYWGSVRRFRLATLPRDRRQYPAG